LVAATAIADADRPTCMKDYLVRARHYFAPVDARAAASRPAHAISEYLKAWKCVMSAN
jgi:hypothetical protein